MPIIWWQACDSIVTSFNKTEDNDFTSNAVKQALLTEYERRKSREIKDITEQTEALMVKRRPVKNLREKTNEGPQYPSTSYKCFNCGKSGHMAKDCR